ncbi:MAG: ribonuclease III [Candidatus Midichloria sp.]|nr:MAG: ribonuclease III [Candidatus Midichloria sp.]
MTIPHTFRNKKLLDKALTHPSFTKANQAGENDYERLEFFGDSVLSMVITELLYKKHINATDSKLSIMHSNLVNSQSLAKVAISINLGKYLIMDEGEEISGGRDNVKNLENAMEALIAAVYLDSNYETVAAFIKKLWWPLLNDKSIGEKDKKSLLQEWVQRNNGVLPIYKIVKREGVAHSPTFIISVTAHDIQAIGIGKSRKEAEQNAATALLNQINELEKKN